MQEVQEELTSLRSQCADLEEQFDDAVQIAELEANKAREYKARATNRDELAAELEVLRSKCAALEGAEGGPEFVGPGDGSARLEEELRLAKCRVKEMEDEAVQAMQERASMQRTLRTTREELVRSREALTSRQAELAGLQVTSRVEVSMI